MIHKLLLLRPEDQAGSLVAMLQQRAATAGVQADCLVHSMVSINGYDDPNHSLRTILSQTWHGGLMVSVNAANYFAQQAQVWAPECAMPVARWFAVGPTSAEAIARVVQRPVTCPWRMHNSDALLQLPELQNVADQRWLLIRGRGGRELVADTLRARGAQVTYLEVYQRVPSKVDLSTIEKWQQQVHGIVVSSAEQLGYFLAALPQHALHWLSQCYWVLASERLAQLLPVAMRQRVVIADSATPFALADAWQRLIKKEDL